MSGGQVNLEGKKIGRYEGKLLSINSLSSDPPTLISSNNHPSPQPSPTGEGVLSHFEGTGYAPSATTVAMSSP